MRIFARGLCVVAGLILGIVATVASQRDVFAQPSRNARRVIRPEKAPNTGLPFSPGILVGSTLYISGHLGRDPITNALVGGGIDAETRQSLANIREVLRTAGMDFKLIFDSLKNEVLYFQALTGADLV